MTGALEPSLGLLIRQRHVARFRRLREQFANPRRRLRAVIAVLLGVLWLGNGLATLVLREPYALESFRTTVAYALLGYFAWAVLKVAFRRPATPIEWKPAERHLLLTGPFTRRQLLVYRLVDALPGTFFKAGCATFFFLPELPFWWAGLIGAALGFHFLEVLRLTVATVACAVPERTYRLGRAVVVGVLAGTLLLALSATIGEPRLNRSPIAAWSLTVSFLGHLWVVLGNLGVSFAAALFQPFAELMTAERLGGTCSWNAAMAIGLCSATTWALLCLTDRYGDDEVAFRPAEPAARVTARSRFVNVPRLGGVGPLAWRQLGVARGHGIGVALALVAPLVLACAPLLLNLDAENTFLNVVAAAAFYSFLLLPSGLKFDFRIEYERLHVLKSLPIRPLAVAVGQILVPIAITAGFQLLVIGIACLVRPVPLPYVLTAVGILVPTTILIYAVDNTLFLLAPHRVRQDGFEVLLKGLLVFTAKGIVFALGIAVVLVWVDASIALDGFLSERGIQIGRRLLFGVGLAGLTAVAATGSVLLLARTFARCEAVPRVE